MYQACFPIVDTDNNQPVPQTTFRYQRLPLSWARGSSDEQYFLTLYSNILAVVSTGFSRAGGEVRPQPKAVVERGWELDENGNELKIRRSVQGCGMDGLESGHRYKVDVDKGSLMGIWWRWDTKEDVLVEPGDLRWNLYDLAPEQAPLEIGDIEGVEFSVE